MIVQTRLSPISVPAKLTGQWAGSITEFLTPSPPHASDALGISTATVLLDQATRTLICRCSRFSNLVNASTSNSERRRSTFLTTQTFNCLALITQVTTKSITARSAKLVAHLIHVSCSLG